MTTRFAHKNKGCSSVAAIYAGEVKASTCMRSADWLIAGEDGQMRRPGFNSSEMAVCPDCGQRVFPSPTTMRVL